jgi:membrane protein YdbS with pleckstrin-like domain
MAIIITEEANMDRRAYIAQLTNGVPDHADPALKTYWLVTRVMGTGLAILLLESPLIVLATLAGTTTPFLLLLAVLVLLFLIIPMAVYAAYSSLEYGNYTFNIEKTHLTISRGILFKQSTTVPYSRVQGVTTNAGPLMRRFGIATISVATAGYVGLMAPTIQGVREPEIVRDVILQRVRELRDEGRSKDLGNGL